LTLQQEEAIHVARLKQEPSGGNRLQACQTQQRQRKSCTTRKVRQIVNALAAIAEISRHALKKCWIYSKARCNRWANIGRVMYLPQLIATTAPAGKRLGRRGRQGFQETGKRYEL